MYTIKILCWGGLTQILHLNITVSIYVKSNHRSRKNVEYELNKTLILLHANKCRCGSKRLHMQDNVHFVRLVCLSCENKTSSFSRRRYEYFRGDKYREAHFANMWLAVRAWNAGEYKDWRDEYAFTCAMEPLSSKIRTPKLKSDKFYRDLLQKHDVKSFYVDQSCNELRALSRYFMSAYTPHGISILDSWYCKAIQELGSPQARFKYSAKQLRKMILKNPHLHEVIKWNLVGNIKSYE